MRRTILCLNKVSGAAPLIINLSFIYLFLCSVCSVRAAEAVNTTSDMTSISDVAPMSDIDPALDIDSVLDVDLMSESIDEVPTSNITPLLADISDAKPGISRPGLSIGVTVSDLGNPFFVQIARGAENQARALAGEDVRIKVVSSAYDLRRQVKQIDQFILEQVDMILLSAADEQAIEPAVLRAKQAGIQVLAVDVKAKGANATVSTDNTQAGNIACEFLVTSLGGSGNVVILNGPSVSSVLERVDGCKQVLSKYPGIHLLSDNENAGGSFQGGMEKMIYLMTAFPNINGVFTINDQIAAGAEEAARQAGSTLVIVGVDGAPIAKQRLKQSNSMIWATAAQFPNLMAEKAVEIGFKLMQGEPIAEENVLIPAELITKKNVSAYKTW